MSSTDVGFLVVSPSLSPNRTSDNNGRRNAYVCSAREAGRASKRSPDFAMTLAVFRGPGGAVCMG
jgi:hypothetical protein